MRVKFRKKGRWATDKVWEPQIEVEAGEIMDISPEFAKIVVDAKAGKILDGDDEKQDNIEPVKDSDLSGGSNKDFKPSIAEKLTNLRRKNQEKNGIDE